MHVLMLHNRYRAEGGEERAVANIVALLTGHGHSVEVLERSSAGISRTHAARGLLAGGLQADEVAEAVHRTRAEIVHGHNLHPLFGWRALAAARAAGARTVLHLHNFRLFCAIAVSYRDGAPCFRCRGSNTLPGLRLRCRGSLGEAAVYAAGLHRQQPQLYANADRFIVLSGATGARMHELGLPAERTRVLGNFVPGSGYASATRAHEGTYALAIGRLVAEKGFDIAIAAARAASVPLVIAGEGPDEQRLRELAVGAAVRFTGWVDHGRLSDLRAGAGVVLVPSRCEEACPYAALDSLAAGVPVLVSDRGGIPERVPADSVIPVEDRRAWTIALAQVWRDEGLRRHRGEEALALARELLSEERYYQDLMAAYGEA
ncbi:MAG: glycosyltransferase family 4 protein [Solirubrobacteraceae bacterium]